MRNDESHDYVMNRTPSAAEAAPPPNSHEFLQGCQQVRRIWGRLGGGRGKKTELPHGNSVEFAKLKPAPASQSYEMGTTLAACKPLGPSSTENSTFCSASNFR